VLRLAREGDGSVSYETILYEKKERLAYITLNRPRLLNAYNDTMGDELVVADLLAPSPPGRGRG